MIFIPLFLQARRGGAATAGEGSGQGARLFKHRIQERAQQLVLSSKNLPGFRGLYAATYSLAARLLVRIARQAEREVGIPVVEAVYLRRGGGRGELVLGGSDLDFFLVLRTVSAQQEMRFLQSFWRKYNLLRNIFPFLGETLMGDRNELENWLQTSCVRAFETTSSWKLLHGADILRELPPPQLPDPRDVFSEALKCYWALVQPVLKLQEEQLDAGISGHSRLAVLLRHGVKAGIDLFRLHFALGKPPKEAARIHSLSRDELLEQLPVEEYGDFLPAFRALLRLEKRPFGESPLEPLAKLIYRGFRCLDGIAASLAEGTEDLVPVSRLVYHAQRAVSDPYSLSVRELFAERILFRHQRILRSCVLSEATAQMYFRLDGVPPLEDFRELLIDLRNVSFSLERFNVPMPLTERCFQQMEKTSLLDSPFHSFYSHREQRIEPNGEIHSRAYSSPAPALPLNSFRKTFSEISFALRMQPDPGQLDHFVEKLFTIVISLRIAVEKGEIATSFRSALDSFAARYPTRHEVLQKQIAPFFAFESAEEKQFWDGCLALLDVLEASQPARAGLIRDTLGTLRYAQHWTEGSATRATDLWINLTPFLRMEMNAVKDRLFPARPLLRL